MDNSLEKEKILQSIQIGLKNANFKNIENTVLENSEIFVSPDKPLFEIFKEEIIKINGECFYCRDKEELVDYLKEMNNIKGLNLCFSPDPKFEEIIKQTEIQYTEKFENSESIKLGISACEYLIARFGSVMVSSALPGGRKVFSFPETHIVIAYENQLVMEIEDGLMGVQKKYAENIPSQIINITGPSRTADIEKTLILGAHGPKRLIVFVLKSE